MTDSSAGDVDVWTVRVPEHLDRLRDYCDLLDENERRRCAAFRFEHLRDAYAVRHGVLRIVLAKYLGVQPRDVEFGFGEAGKPFVARPAKPIQFNMSDSGDLAVIAVTQGAEVGIDVELMKAEAPPWEIAAQLAPAERAALEAERSGEAKTRLLYRIWTRKEAYLKGLACGLGFALDAFAVPTSPAESWELNNWSGRDFSPAEGYAGSLLVHGRLGEVRHRVATPGGDE
jgi:4'-phosphopantetheinyl transferase